MAIETRCQTPGAQFMTRVGDGMIEVQVSLPGGITFDEETASLVEANLHNAIELVLAPYFAAMRPAPPKPTVTAESVVSGILAGKDWGEILEPWARDVPGFTRLVFDPSVSDESPTVRGTWVTVGRVISLIVDGWSWSMILKNYPELSEDDIRDCLGYANLR